MKETAKKQKGWAVMFIFWNLALLIVILVLLFQLYIQRLDTGTIAKVCAQAAVEAVQNLK